MLVVSDDLKPIEELGGIGIAWPGDQGPVSADARPPQSLFSPVVIWE
jgi:hypothetical protein